MALGLATSPDDVAPSGARPTTDSSRDRDDDAVLAGPPRGSLAGDAAYVEAVRGRPWGTDEDPPVADREVVLVTETEAGRVALVLADGPTRTRGVWFTGPAGAEAGALRPWEPDRVSSERPAPLLLPGPAGAVLVVVAAPGDVVEVSPRLAIDATGAATRSWAAVPAPDGVAVMPVVDVAAGMAAALRVRRGGEVVHRSAFPLPADEPPTARPLTLPPIRPGSPADPHAVGEAVRRAAAPLGVPAPALDPQLLWAAELTRTGGLGSVAVVTASAPGGGGLVTTHGRMGAAGSGRQIPCGTAPLPGGTDPAALTVAAVCNVFDGIEVEPDRSWLVVTAPPAAVRAEVLDERGVVLDTVDLAGGGSVSRTPDGTVAVRTLDASGRPLDVATVPSAGFGDYGEDDG